MPPQKTVWDLEDHTAAKHRVLRGYLDAWLPIMGNSFPRLVLVDGFAGPGVYTNGDPGSPIVMLQAYLDHAARESITAELVYVFVEAEQARFDRLTAEIAKLDLPKNVKTHLFRDSFESILSGLLDDLTSRGQHIAPAFAFIDPFGYTGAPMTLTGKFLGFSRCEVLIYVPLRFVNRFLSMPDQESALNNLFGTERWRAAVDMSSEDRLQFLHDLFRDQLRAECDLEHVRSFEIVTSARNSGYHLFFGTNHDLGLARMKDAMWSVDPAQGECFRDSTVKGLTPLFEPEPDTAPLGDALEERFRGEVFTIEEAERFTLVDTPYRIAHLRRRTLAPLERAGKLEAFDPPAGRRANTYAGGTKLRFT